MLYVIMGAMGALIGWGTNIVAIWLLFRPQRPIRLGSWQLQGLLPRRQADIAMNIGQAIERELFYGLPDVHSNVSHIGNPN